MKKIWMPLAVACALMLSVTSCKKEAKETNNPIPQETLDKIYQLGFGTSDVQRHEDGYLVEGDIILRESDLNSTPERQLIRFPSTEQYHTFNLVKGLPRVITVSMSSRLPVSYAAAIEKMCARYNALNLSLTFDYIGTDVSASIVFVKGGGNYLASAGFPDAGGNPYGQVKVNSTFIGSNPNSDYLTTILAHEAGHCIGFRHSDWMNRAISCGGSPSNEGQQTTGVGAVHIANTPTTPTNAQGSWMLACIGSGQNRPFNSADQYSLDFLY
jgi:hypothetical protein